VLFFLIWDENNVDNILMFSVVARLSRILQLLALAWPASYRGSWEGAEPGQLTQSGHRAIPHHRPSGSAPSWGSWLGSSDHCSRMG